MKRNIANALTISRILCGVCLLFFEVFSLSFYILYVVCGLSDMLDGFVARKTKSATEFDSKLDSIADVVFLICASVKLLPEIDLPPWIWLWILLIFIVKIVALVLKKTITLSHNRLNKICGFLLFIFPLTLSFITIEYSASIICILASISAIWEINKSLNLL